MTKSLQSRFRLLAFALVWSLWNLSGSFSAFAVEEVSIRDVPVVVDHFQFGLTTSYRATDGRFDPYGYYSQLPDGASGSSISTSFNMAYRASQKWEFDAALPVRRSERTSPTGSSMSTSVGGVSIGSKFHAGGWPHLILHLGADTPWHTSSKSVTGNPQMSMFGSDSGSSDGSGGKSTGGAISVGAGVSRTFRPFRASLDVTGTTGLAQMQDQGDAPPGYPQVSVRSGNRIQLSEGLSYLMSSSWNINTSLKQLWGGDTTADGIDQTGTASRAFSTSLGVSYSPSKDWRLNLAYTTLYPFYAYAVNQSYGPSLSLGMVFMNL